MSNMFHDGIPHEVALPLLMTYMGHATLSETGKYLKLTAEAFPDLVEQINKIFGAIMPDLEVKTEYEDDE
jgi:integrase/recombinase XerD